MDILETMTNTCLIVSIRFFYGLTFAFSGGPSGPAAEGQFPKAVSTRSPPARHRRETNGC